eukprot:gene629-3943_t
MSAPMQMSSKSRPPPVRRVIQAPRKHRDPRFDPRCGNLDERKFDTSYDFLDKTRSTEIQVLTKRLRKARNTEEKDKLKRLIQGLKEQNRCRQEKLRKSDVKAKSNQMTKESKGKFFLKKSECKKLELLEKFQALKKEGNLDKALRNRRKHNLQKDTALVGRKSSSVILSSLAITAILCPCATERMDGCLPVQKISSPVFDGVSTNSRLMEVVVVVDDVDGDSCFKDIGWYVAVVGRDSRSRSCDINSRTINFYDHQLQQLLRPITSKKLLLL